MRLIIKYYDQIKGTKIVRQHIINTADGEKEVNQNLATSLLEFHLVFFQYNSAAAAGRYRLIVLISI